MTQTAPRVEKQRLVGGAGLETKLDVAAVLFLAAGILLFCALVLTFTLWSLAAGIGILIAAVLIWLVLRCLAEFLRIQKRLVGLDYEGRISGTREESIFACGNCGHMLHSDSRCDGCGFSIATGGGNAGPEIKPSN